MGIQSDILDSSVIRSLKFGAVDTSNNVFKLFANITPAIFWISSALVVASTYIGDPIKCMSEQSIAETVCWIHGHFAIINIPWRVSIGQHTYCHICYFLLLHKLPPLPFFATIFTLNLMMIISMIIVLLLILLMVFTIMLIITLSCAIQLACDIEQVADGVGHLDFGRGPTFNLFRS